MEIKTVAVTGGFGFIGHSVTQRLLSQGFRVVRLTRGAGSNTTPSEKREWLELLASIEGLVHLGWQTSIKIAEEDPSLDFEQNVRPVLMALEAAKELGKKVSFVFASSATVFGMPLRTPVGDDHPDSPLTAYDQHKWMAENYFRLYSQMGVVHAASLRLSNVYGPGPTARLADRGILNQMIDRALASQPLTLYGEGSELRDYIYIDDVADAFVRALVSAEKCQGRSFLISSGVGTSLARAFQEVAAVVSVRTQKPVEVVSVPRPGSSAPTDSRSFVGDSSRFTALTGWKPEVTLREGIERTLEFKLGSKPPKTASPI